MGRYLPLAVLVTGLVTVAPALLVTAIAPRTGPYAMVISGACAVALSIALASAAAAVWKRQPRSRDILFADLLLWGWLRRWWTERGLSRARELYDSACAAGPMVSIELLAGLGRLLEARDAYTHGHGRRVARHAGRIAGAMHLSATEAAKIRTAAAVHDLGKLYTPREILNNPGRLSAAEFDIVKRHAADGAEMLAGVGDPEIAAMVRHHHERVDGHGYPDGLAGSEIPLGARIIAVADTFDAITSNRAYRGAGTQKQALQVLARGAGSQLDPAAVAAFRHRYSGRRAVVRLAVATAVSQRVVIALQAASQSVGAGGSIASILPALGAAGLFSLAPALHEQPSTITPPHPALVRSHRSAAAPAGERRTHRLATRRGSTRHTASGPSQHAIRRIAPVKTTPRHLAGPPHTSAGVAPSAAGRAPSSSPDAAGSSPTPTPAPGPVTVPQIEVAPPPPPPGGPPASTPNLPVVTVPAVPIPPVTVPVAPIPAIKG
jgi:HD-GYP domain-containing protein (c-di-GMP phosphodiesterase class II)